MHCAFLKVGNSRVVFTTHGHLIAWPTEKFKPSHLTKLLCPGEGVLFSSVVPKISKKLKSTKAFRTYEFKLSDLPMKPAYSSIGIDRLLNLVGAREITKKSIVVLDIGTALTVDFFDARKKKHLGGWIVAGPHLMAKALEKFTAQLPYEAPDFKKSIDAVPGQSTKQSLGMGQRAFVRGMINEAKRVASKLFGSQFALIITGGGANLLGGSREMIVTDLWIKAMQRIVQNENERSKSRRSHS